MRFSLFLIILIANSLSGYSQESFKKTLCDKWWAMDKGDLGNDSDTLMLYSNKSMNGLSYGTFGNGVIFKANNVFVKQVRCGSVYEKMSWKVNGTIIEIYKEKSHFREERKLWFKFKVLRLKSNFLMLKVVKE